MNLVEQIFEKALWNSRFVVLLAVISSLFTAFAMFYMATVDTFYTIQHLTHYASSEMDVVTRADLRGQTVTYIVEVIDGFLLAAVLLIFSMGVIALAVFNEKPKKMVRKGLRSRLNNTIGDAKKSSAMEAEDSVTSSESRSAPQAGTGFGEQRYSPVRLVQFQANRSCRKIFLQV